ncbi:hypothetical protein MG293_018589 [Ovis ammon polii]|uniref:Uncharacterized protein n=1 Tax=Ovis ammon polii TaxID=230172 RepID=A0AAD4TQ81_OVIAM|nr:hypothetical protein MG293_018589 [Ovis ammon polii]
MALTPRPAPILHPERGHPPPASRHPQIQQHPISRPPSRPLQPLVPPLCSGPPGPRPPSPSCVQGEWSWDPRDKWMEMQCSGPSAQVCTRDPSDTGQPGSCPHSAGPTASLPEALMGFLALSPRVPLGPDHALPQGPSSNVLPFLCDTDAFKFRSNTIFGTLGSLSAAPFLWPDQISSGGRQALLLAS